VERYIYPQTVVLVTYHNKNPTQCVGLVQSGHASSHQNVTCSCHDIAANCPVGAQQ
jgi:hypothetical protein